MQRPNLRTTLTSGYVEYIDHMGDDLAVVNSARVSFNNQSKWDHKDEMYTKIVEAGFSPEEAKVGSQQLNDKDVKLIRYLATHDHWTPFAHPQITFRIKAPIPIRTQFFKHKLGFVENECSRRYVDDPPDFYIPFWRSRPADEIKQGSGDFIEGEALDDCHKFYADIVSLSGRMYGILTQDYGIAPEQARFILPQGMMTEWYWTGSLAAYARFYRLRVDPHAQWEIRVYAKTIGEFLDTLFPESWAALVGDLRDISVPEAPPSEIP